MGILTTLIYLVTLPGFGKQSSAAPPDYWKYHAQIIEVEQRISQEDFAGALDALEEIFTSYDFIFLRAYKIAAQLAFHVGNTEKAFKYIEAGMAAGWPLKRIKKHPYLSQLRDHPYWKSMAANYADLHNGYLECINSTTREQVRKMYKKDQWKALGALFRIGDKAQEKYALRKFAPHSEVQMRHLMDLLEHQGYPGEQLIGNDYWMSTIISHHNSITQQYVQEDTLYPLVKPLLIQAIGTGQMSPVEFAMIDDWRIAVASGRKDAGYGFLNPPQTLTLMETDKMRQKIGLRTVGLRNKLVDIEEASGMQFYLPDWVPGKIKVE